tara:strand:- start:720 stop:1070 length:351 start_codon:yes stop_codon:yes gene_type:complete
MSKRIVNKEHLRYVSTLPCFITRAGFMSCKGPIQVHHLLKPNEGYKGTSNRLGVKSNDSDVIPLCQFHHAQLHTKFGNEYKFLAKYGFRKTAAQEYAKQLWERSSDIYESDSDLPF